MFYRSIKNRKKTYDGQEVLGLLKDLHNPLVAISRRLLVFKASVQHLEYNLCVVIGLRMVYRRIFT